MLALVHNTLPVSAGTLGGIVCVCVREKHVRWTRAAGCQHTFGLEGGLGGCELLFSVSLSPSLFLSPWFTTHLLCKKQLLCLSLSPCRSLSLSLVCVHFHMFESEDSSLFPDTQRLLSKKQLLQQHLKVSNHYCVCLCLSLSLSLFLLVPVLLLHHFLWWNVKGLWWHLFSSSCASVI